MFGVPLLVTGMFYFMFGNMAESDGFDLPRTKVIIANMDAGRTQVPGQSEEHPRRTRSQDDG